MEKSTIGGKNNSEAVIILKEENKGIEEISDKNEIEM